jgi:class 3 adenylate cyclase
VAARISALAEADEILVSAAVVDAVGRHVTIARRGSTDLKVFPHP